jgi:outer membrane protein OmpA-like peptidoglycan-associated protein
MMITAEPYYSVSLPSDVVVAENVVRPDTIGTREEVVAKYELLPRGQYTMTIQPASLRTLNGEAEKLSYDRYEAILELYQAENAVQIARSLGADQYARDSIDKAAALLSQAQDMNARKQDTHAIVSAAREATQMAEDARTIAVRRRDEERHQQEAQPSRDRSELRRLPPEQTEEARALPQTQSERLAPPPAPQRMPVLPPPPNPSLDRSAAQQQVRAQLFAQLNSTLTTRDTPRGLVVTLGDSMFESGNGNLRAVASQPLANLAAVLSSHPGLSVRVEGYADTEPLSNERARSVQTALIVSGAAAPGLISAVGYGNSRPIAPQTSAAGREQNRRVEVVIYGDSIGDHALWDHPYSLRSPS